jgi:hypothetical protein
MSVIKKTETRNTKSGGYIARLIMGILFGAVEVLLAIRLVFKLLDANSQNSIVQGIYELTHYIVGIFEGIFLRIAPVGAHVTAVFEPATVIAMIVVAMIAWVILKLMAPLELTRVQKTEYTDHDNRSK